MGSWKRFSFHMTIVLSLFINEYYVMGNGTTETSSQLQVHEAVRKAGSHFHAFRARSRRQGALRPLFSSSYYTECEQSKLNPCYPTSQHECFKTRNCTYLVTWKLVPKTDYIEFKVITQQLAHKSDGELCYKKALPPDTFQYLAIGFSGRSSKKNERIAVIECSITEPDTQGNSTTNVIFGWSTKTEFKRWNHDCTNENSTNTGKLIRCKVNLDKAAMLCHFQVKRRVVFNHEIFNFEELQYYVHFTSGCNVSDIQRSFFNGGRYLSSDQVLYFHSKEEHAIHIFRSTNALWHGSLMIVAWSMLIPNGMFISRYFKESFVEISIFKYRVWFAGHSMFMIMAFVITVASLGTILQERSEVDFAWPVEKSTQLHYNLGFAASLSLIGQVSIGWIRCAGRKLRRSFAAIHLFIGCSCYMISLVIIGLSYKVGMPCNIQYYVAASSLWTLMCHVGMTVHFYRLDKQLGLYIYRALYPFPIAPVTYDELPGTKIRISIFLIHLTGNMVLTIGMVIDYLTSEVCKK